jgi:hypothetical protein
MEAKDNNLTKQEITVTRIVEVLQRLPEKRLQIFDITPELLDEKGQIDVRKVLPRRQEVNLAIAEARAQCRATGEARLALEEIGRKK